MTQFNPNEHLIPIKSGQGSQDYLPVQWRLVWFRSVCPDGTIDTEELAYDLDREVEAEVYVWNPEKKRSEKVIKKARGYARYRAVVMDGKGGRATGTKSENAASFADFGEKAETGAIGRALAALGYGTQFAPELSEEHRIVDAPVERVVPESSDPLNDMIGRAKMRAQQLGVARNAAEWSGLLDHLHLKEIKFLADIAKVNGYLSQVEQKIPANGK